MDYLTKPLKRRRIRQFSVNMRILFGIPLTGPFPVLEVLDRIEDFFPQCSYSVVMDEQLPNKMMARCVPNESGGYTIEIKQAVYDGAYKRRIGAYLGFIMHEVCHLYLLLKGYKPIFEIAFPNNTLPAYCSMEWQAKALCSEVMIPYKESIGMSVETMIRYYCCSRAFAEFRLRI
ncbi:MAG: hypothetical protein J5757_09000 [Lachnospiraceae bacterium]|nr:hypothetical protein [Lachnospiraceae bacterium]